MLADRLEIVDEMSRGRRVENDIFYEPRCTNYYGIFARSICNTRRTNKYVMRIAGESALCIIKHVLKVETNNV